MEKITTCIMTFNEENNIKECILSVKYFSDEILVVDSFSTDKTVKIANDLGAKVILQKFLGYSEQRQFAIENAKFNWVFCIDADERATKELCLKIKELKEKNFEGYHGFFVNRRNYYFGVWIKYGGWYPEKRIRLFHRNYGKSVGINPHDKIEMVKGAKIKDLNLDIIHFPYRDLTHHIEVINRYSSIAAEEKIKKGENISFLNLIFNPLFKFFKAYILKRGFLMGKIGFIHATLGSISVFMKYLKAWEMKNVKSKKS